MSEKENQLSGKIESIGRVQEKIADQMSPLLEAKEKLTRLTIPYANSFSSISSSNLLSDSAMTQLNSAFQSVRLQLASSTLDVIKQISLALQNSMADSIKDLIEYCASVFTDTVKTPVLDWLRSFTLLPQTNELADCKPHPLPNYHGIKEAYLRIMYEAKWFPYVGLIARMGLFNEVTAIVLTSRGASKRRERRIDKAIISYYSDAEIRCIKNSWWESDLDFCVRRTLCQAMDAFLRGEYALTIPCLATMWEGLIYTKAKGVDISERKRQNIDATKKDLKELAECNNYGEIFSEYFDKFIVSTCNGVDDVIDGVPNRHSVAHSWYKRYPNRKAALNAILLTHFIINLEVNISEDQLVQR